MTADTSKTHDSNRPELKASPAQLEKQEAAKKAIADKAAKKLAAETKKAETTAARAASAEARAKSIADNAAAREAKAEELKASGRTYVGSMTQLAERVKAGAYVKSMTGQLRSSDELAVALDAVPPVNVVLLGIKALKLESNPYPHLNIGQQSMNLRNRMRGAIKKGTLTLEEVKNIRDNDGLATAEAEVAKKKEAAAERVKKAEDAKAAKLAADAKALEAKQLKEAEALKAKTAAPAQEAKSEPAPAVKTAAVKKAKATA